MFTEKEVAYLEANFYTVSMGKEFLHDDEDKFAFSEKTALYYRNRAASGLNKIIKEGDDPEEIKEAKDMLLSLKIIPLRIQ